MSDTSDRPQGSDIPPVRVLISYRREDSAGHAGRLYDSLIESFGPEQVFIDIAAIEPGVDFSEVIAREVGSCDVLLAVIGRNWLNITDAKGRRRLDNPDDFHRLEIQAALERNIRVVPLLVQNAVMPSLEDLPPPIQRLALRNALELSDERWQYDVGRLVAAIESVARAKGLRPREAGAAAVPPADAGEPDPATSVTPPVPVFPDPGFTPTPPPPPGDLAATIPVLPPAATMPLGPPPAPPPGGTPVPGASEPPKRDRKALVLVIAGVVLLAAIGGGILMLTGGEGEKPLAGPVSPTPTATSTPGDSPSPSPSPSPSVSLDAEQAELVARVPSAFSGTCIPDEGFLPDNSTAAIKCTSEGNEVWYYLFPTGADVDAWYDKQRNAWNLEPDDGDCEIDDRGEDEVYVSDEPVGRLLCYNDDTGRWLEWKRADYRVYAYARRTDRLKQELFDFWKTAGPLGA